MPPLPERVPSRVIIEGVRPEIDAGRFPVKRTIGEQVVVAADVHTDGHELLAGVLRYRPVDSPTWLETPLEPEVNDRWTARFQVTQLGAYEYTIEAWIDRFGTWRRDLGKKAAAEQDLGSDLLEGAELIRQTARRIGGAEGEWLLRQADVIGSAGDQQSRLQAALEAAVLAMMQRHVDRGSGYTYERVLRVTVDPQRARFGAWYELFPRSAAEEPGTHGTLGDVEKRLPYVAQMGFDVLYLPPIHPIGRSFRKGPNNTLTPGPTDPGSPWAIGSESGGHKSVHPELGTLADFDRLVAAARTYGIEIAMDIAFQCSPDHPYVREHPQWFKKRPDGTIKYAENPPKKYQDIYPLDFEGDDWRSLWSELRDVFLFWCERGIRIFRVDNPHTKSFRFWEWCLAEVKQRHADAIFLSEAFTRPKVMKYLAKSGFSQSYTYFTWRNTKHDITAYFTELTQTDVREYMRPNLFANTPDILPEFLQHSGVNGFRIRLVLAATLGATYGVYGPVYEFHEARALPEREEYLDSEKFQVHHWDWSRPNVFREFITLINRIRRENPALHHDHRLKFYHVDNDRLLFYGKTSPDNANVIFVIVNLDPHHTQSGWLRMPLEELGLAPHETYQVHDLVTNAHFLWSGESNFVQIEPGVSAHILRLRKRVRTERDFDYFL